VNSALFSAIIDLNLPQVTIARGAVPSTATSVAGKAHAPRIENSQDPKWIRTVQDCLQLKFIIEPHFAGRKSLM
jgi:hypothetical protein